MAETLNFRADTDLKIYTSSGTPPSGTPSDGNAVAEWRDYLTPASRDRSMISTGSPTWGSPGAMLLPSIHFGGSAFFSTLQVDSTSVASSTFLGSSSCALLNSAKTVIISFRATAVATNNANIYDNTPLFTDTGGYFGSYLKTISGTTNIYGYNYSGAAHVTSAIAISLNTDYVVMLRHDATNLNISVLSGAGGGTRYDQSVASGSTGAGSGRNLRVGKVYSAAATYFTGYMGEILCHDTDLGSTSTPLTDVVGRWLPASGGGGSSGSMLLAF